MSSVINIVCDGCEEGFQGYLLDIPLAGVKYAAGCPKCKTVVSFTDKAGWIQEEIPADAVKIYEK